MVDNNRITREKKANIVSQIEKKIVIQEKAMQKIKVRKKIPQIVIAL